MSDDSEDLGSEETPRRPADDPRFQRVRHKLIEAVLSLGAQKPAEQITVSELTEQAGISRTTFYKHAESPASLLADHLIEELRPLVGPIVGLLDDTGPGYLLRWRQIHLDLLRHVADNRDVYEQVFAGPGQSVVLSMISNYFGSVFDAFVREFTRHVEGPVPSELWVTMASIQQVHNTIVMLSAWLRTGMVEDPDVVVATYVSLVPPWQVARFSDAGLTTLKSPPERHPLKPGERIVLGTVQQPEGPQN